MKENTKKIERANGRTERVERLRVSIEQDKNITTISKKSQ
jgi:hypothetical protein